MSTQSRRQGTRVRLIGLTACWGFTIQSRDHPNPRAPHCLRNSGRKRSAARVRPDPVRQKLALFDTLAPQPPSGPQYRRQAVPWHGHLAHDSGPRAGYPCHGVSRKLGSFCMFRTPAAHSAPDRHVAGMEYRRDGAPRPSVRSSFRQPAREKHPQADSRQTTSPSGHSNLLPAIVPGCSRPPDPPSGAGRVPAAVGSASGTGCSRSAVRTAAAAPGPRSG